MSYIRDLWFKQLGDGFVEKGSGGFSIVAGLTCDGTPNVVKGREIRSVLRPPAAVRSDDGEAMALSIYLDIKAFRLHVLGALLQAFGLAML